MKLLNVHYLFIIVFCLGLGYLRYIRHQAPTGEIREKNMRSSFFFPYQFNDLSFGQTSGLQPFSHSMLILALT